MASSNGYSVASTMSQVQRLALFQNKVFGQCIAPLRNLHTFSVLCDDQDGIIYNMANYTYSDNQINDYYNIIPGGGGGTKAALNCPVGAGVKYKVKPRLNIGAEWTFRFTTTDALDTGKDSKQLIRPYAIKSTGFKNMDCYSFLMFFLTYDMLPKCKTCHNNDQDNLTI